MRDKAVKDISLVHRASIRVTGATVHKFNNVLQNYYWAIELHNSNVEEELAEVILADSYSKVLRFEIQLRLFK